MVRDALIPVPSTGTVISRYSLRVKIVWGHPYRISVQASERRHQQGFPNAGCCYFIHPIHSFVVELALYYISARSVQVLPCVIVSTYIKGL
jgi:hypothetical protein